MGRLKEKYLTDIVSEAEAASLLYNIEDEIPPDDIDSRLFDLSVEDYLDYLDKSHSDYYRGLLHEAEEMHSGVPHPLESETFCKADILSAIDYAFDQIQITPEEVGVEVYNELLTEQVLVYLKQIIVY